MVTYMAGRMKDRMNASAVDIDDLQSGAALGLLQSIRRHDPKMANLTTYASRRMVGAMRDELRELDWVPRLVRARKEPTIEMKSMDTFVADLRYPREFPEAVDHRARPAAAAAARDLWRRLRQLLGGRVAEILELYYRANYTLKEIGRLLGLSESRVCQLHAKGILEARLKLGALA